MCTFDKDRCHGTVQLLYLLLSHSRLTEWCTYLSLCLERLTQKLNIYCLSLSCNYFFWPPSIACFIVYWLNGKTKQNMCWKILRKMFQNSHVKILRFVYGKGIFTFIYMNINIEYSNSIKILNLLQQKQLINNNKLFSWGSLWMQYLIQIYYRGPCSNK